jgi:glutamyl-tRNA synthetase
MGWGNAFFKNIVKEGDVVKSMDCEINPDGDVKTTKLKMTWLANWNELVPVELKDYDYMITKKKPEESDEFKDIVNPTTEVVTMAKGDGNLRAYNRGTVIQIERKGYYVVDRVYVNMDTPMILLSIPDGKKASWGVSAK